MTKFVTIRLNDFEEKMLADLTSLQGYRPQEAFRISLRMLHEKEFPPKPARKAAKPPVGSSLPPTAEQWAIEQGGELIIKDDGQKLLRVMEGAMETLKPVPKEYE